MMRPDTPIPEWVRDLESKCRTSVVSDRDNCLGVAETEPSKRESIGDSLTKEGNAR